jgi:hypothetical protein
VTAPDLSEARQHAEAVAYGRLVAVREILDALARDRLSPMCNPPGYADGYDRAVQVVKAMRLGVDK